MKRLLIAAAVFASLSVPALAQDSDYQETSTSHDYGYASYGDGRSNSGWSSYYAPRRYADYGGYEGYSRGGYGRSTYGYGYSGRYRSSRYGYRPYAYDRGDDGWRRHYRYRHGCGCSGYRDDDPD